MNILNEKIANFLKVLADTTRLDILELLKGGEKHANQIQTALNKSQSTISQHLKTLTNADLVKVRREGTKKFFFIKDNHIFDIISSANSFISSLDKEKIDVISSVDILDTLY